MGSYRPKCLEEIVLIKNITDLSSFFKVRKYHICEDVENTVAFFDNYSDAYEFASKLYWRTCPDGTIDSEGQWDRIIDALQDHINRDSLDHWNHNDLISKDDVSETLNNIKSLETRCNFERFSFISSIRELILESMGYGDTDFYLYHEIFDNYAASLRSAYSIDLIKPDGGIVSFCSRLYFSFKDGFYFEKSEEDKTLTKAN